MPSLGVRSPCVQLPSAALLYIRTAVVVSQGFVQNESLGPCLYRPRIKDDRLSHRELLLGVLIEKKNTLRAIRAIS